MDLELLGPSYLALSFSGISEIGFSDIRLSELERVSLLSNVGDLSEVFLILSMRSEYLPSFA